MSQKNGKRIYWTYISNKYDEILTSHVFTSLNII